MSDLFAPSVVAKAKQIIEICVDREFTLTAAESCTGGLVMGALTEVPGASAVIHQSYITYANGAKAKLLSVPPAMLVRHGAVSEPIACSMAKGAQMAANADVALAVTGVAGPGGGSAEKPVGLVHMAVCVGPGILRHERHLFPDTGRTGLRLASVEAVLALTLVALG